MKLQRPETLAEITDLINRFTSKRSVCNNYLLPSELDSALTSGNMMYCASGPNCYLFIKKPGAFLRLYYILNDLDHKPCFDTEMPIMTEVLFRGSLGIPEKEIAFLVNSGFCVNLRRDQYTVSASEIQGLVPLFAPSPQIVAEAVGLFNKSFDKYSGDFIPQEDVMRLYKERRILCILNDNMQFAGALELAVSARNGWISHVAVSPKFRKQGVADKLLRMFAQAARERGAARLMLWVQSCNKAAIALYEKYGFKYTNKSTISLIKE